MLSRTTTRTVTFLMPFSVAAANQELPAGAYLVETDEELIQELSFPLTDALRRFCGYPQGAWAVRSAALGAGRSGGTRSGAGEGCRQLHRNETSGETPLTMGGNAHEES